MTENRTVGVVSTRRVWALLTIAAVSIATVMAFALSARNNDKMAAGSKPGSRPASNTVTLAPEQRASVVSSAGAPGALPVHAWVPGRIEFNANKVTPLFAQLSGRVVRLDVEVGTSV